MAAVSPGFDHLVIGQTLLHPTRAFLSTPFTNLTLPRLSHLVSSSYTPPTVVENAGRGAVEPLPTHLGPSPLRCLLAVWQGLLRGLMEFVGNTVRLGRLQEVSKFYLYSTFRRHSVPTAVLHNSINTIILKVNVDKSHFKKLQKR